MRPSHWSAPRQSAPRGRGRAVIDAGPPLAPRRGGRDPRGRPRPEPLRPPLAPHPVRLRAPGRRGPRPGGSRPSPRRGAARSRAGARGGLRAAGAEGAGSGGAARRGARRGGDGGAVSRVPACPRPAGDGRPVLRGAAGPGRTVTAGPRGGTRPGPARPGAPGPRPTGQRRGRVPQTAPGPASHRGLHQAVSCSWHRGRVAAVAPSPVWPVAPRLVPTTGDPVSASHGWH